MKPWAPIQRYYTYYYIVEVGWGGIENQSRHCLLHSETSPVCARSREGCSMCERCLSAPAVQCARCMCVRARATCLERLLNSRIARTVPLLQLSTYGEHAHHPARPRVRRRRRRCRGRRGVWLPASRGGDRPPSCTRTAVMSLSMRTPSAATTFGDISRNLSRALSLLQSAQLVCLILQYRIVIVFISAGPQRL